ncbi:Ankyrin repeat-containing domain protein [Penicillium cf. viridicatum]|uniref:Ankyrin repeat-containing domain protein n=1 Tax=Penicillium cf. viridicatum TaxID=2972119 RepID=A0A9W9J1Z6_9EURO|nr:Ankyrin repeat-containing domain protein [Penicillium cf. viridicatum]
MNFPSFSLDISWILALAGRSPHYDSITLRITGILYVDFPNLPPDAALWPGQVMGLLAKYTPKQIEGLPDLLRTLLASSASVETDCILISRNARAITVVKRQHNGFPSQSKATQLAGEVVEINRDLDNICCTAGDNGDDGDEDTKIVYNKIRELGEVHSQSRYLDQVGQTLQAWSLIDSEAHHLRFNHIIPISTAPLILASNGFADQMCTSNDEVLQIRSPEGFGYITAAYHISQLAGKLRESEAVLSYAFDHHHTVTCTARTVWLSLCRQFLLQQPLLFSRISGMVSAILRLTSFSEANLRTLFDGLLQAASDDPVFCLIYSSQIHRKSAEKFLRQLQSLGRSLATLRMILVLEDESQNDDTACSTNAESSFGWITFVTADEIYNGRPHPKPTNIAGGVITFCDIVGDLAKVIGPLIQSADNHVFLHDACHSVLVRRFCQVFSHEALLESCLDYLDLVLPQLKKASSHNSLAPELGLLRYVTRAFQFLSREKDCGVWIRWYNKLERNGDPIHEAEQTPLQIACRFGLVGLVKHCIPITKAAENAQSIMDGALEIAARYGYEGVIKVLLSHNAIASPGTLSLAVRTGSESCVTEIIHAGVNVDQEDEKSYSPLHYSVLAGSPGITALLLANGATIDKAGPDGATALHLAAMTGQNVMVEGLLKSNATINLPDASGHDALKAAARAGSSGIVRLLIEAGANPDTFANDGNNALYVALEAGDLAVISIILDRTQDVASCNQAGYRPLDLAAQQGNLHALQELIQRLRNSSADGIMQCDDESTEDTWRFPEDSRLPLLAIAARHGHRDIIKWFLQPSNRIGREAGSWAIYEAAAGGHVKVLEELLPRGESEKWPVALDQMGRTPLHMTAERGNRAALEGLLEYHQFHVDMTDDKKTDCSSPSSSV